MTTPGRTLTIRHADLAKIHMAKKALGLDDDAYRDLLRGATGKASSADLNGPERTQVLQALQQAGWQPKDAKTKGRPPLVRSDAASLIKKLEAQLTVANRPWAYAHGIAQHMFQLDTVQLCTPQQLRKIIAALAYDAKRRAKKAQVSHG